MQKIEFLNANDIISTATLERVQYKIRLLYNDAGGYWTISLRTPENTPLLEGVKAVPNYPLLKLYHRPGLPPGELLAVTLDASLQTIGRDDFTTNKAHLVYVTEAEMNAI